ncbi:40481_t:CDS:2, partial [Gigaspora margarita]
MYAANYYSLDLTMLEEAQLYKWVKEVRQHELAITYSNLRVKMAKILNKSSKQTKDKTKKLTISNFKLISFKQFVICFCQKNKYPLNMIANMDEMPVWFDMVGNLIVDPKGAKMYKAPSIIIFKGKVWSTNTPLPPAGHCNSKAMLVLDSFSAYITDQIKAELHSGNTDLAVIPGVSLIVNSGNGLTKSENLRHANLNTVRNEDHLIYEDSEDEDNKFDENVTGSDEDKEYNEPSDEDEKSDENKESDKDENTDECN